MIRPAVVINKLHLHDKFSLVERGVSRLKEARIGVGQILPVFLIIDLAKDLGNEGEVFAGEFEGFSFIDSHGVNITLKRPFVNPFSKESYSQRCQKLLDHLASIRQPDSCQVQA